MVQLPGADCVAVAVATVVGGGVAVFIGVGVLAGVLVAAALTTTGKYATGGRSPIATEMETAVISSAKIIKTTVTRFI